MVKTRIKIKSIGIALLRETFDSLVRAILTFVKKLYILEIAKVEKSERFP